MIGLPFALPFKLDWKKLAIVGVIIGFLAIPVGSYFVIKGYVEENARLEATIADKDRTIKELLSSIDKLKSIRALEETIDNVVQQSFEAVSDVLMKMREGSRKFENETSSDVLKETIRLLKENAE
jgi:hypothetical protein